MPNYTPEEEARIAFTERLFDTTNPENKSLLFAEDAIWWNGLPFVGGNNGQTEHKGRAAINGILTGATSGPSEKKTNTGVDAYDVSTIRNEDIVLLADGDYTRCARRPTAVGTIRTCTASSSDSTKTASSNT